MWACPACQDSQECQSTSRLLQAGKAAHHQAGREDHLQDGKEVPHRDKTNGTKDRVKVKETGEDKAKLKATGELLQDKANGTRDTLQETWECHLLLTIPDH